jgi:CheY-like chemotaxis protein
MLPEQAGYIVLTALDGEEGLELFRSHAIDLVISDHVLPGRSGADLGHQTEADNPNIADLGASLNDRRKQKTLTSS